MDNMAFMIDLYTKHQRKLVCDITSSARLATTVELFANLKQNSHDPPAPCVRRTLVALLLYLGEADTFVEVRWPRCINMC